MSLDGIDLLGSMPVVGGDARFEVSCASPASGKHCLKAIDGPTRHRATIPTWKRVSCPSGPRTTQAATLQFDLKVDRGATVVVDVRSDSVPAKQQPRLTVEPDGRVRLCNHALGNIPADQWIHATLSYDFGRSGTPSTCRASLALPDGKTLESPSVATPAADLRRTDRVVVFAPGAALAGFSLDNLELAARKPDGHKSRSLVRTSNPPPTRSLCRGNSPCKWPKCSGASPRRRLRFKHRPTSEPASSKPTARRLHPPAQPPRPTPRLAAADRSRGCPPRHAADPRSHARRRPETARNPPQDNAGRSTSRPSGSTKWLNSIANDAPPHSQLD